jgi:hypothetical protein
MLEHYLALVLESPRNASIQAHGLFSIPDDSESRVRLFTDDDDEIWGFLVPLEQYEEEKGRGRVDWVGNQGGGGEGWVG